MVTATYTILRRVPAEEGRSKFAGHIPSCPDENHVHWTLMPFYVPGQGQAEQEVVQRASAMFATQGHVEGSILSVHWDLPWYMTIRLGDQQLPQGMVG